MNPLLRWIVDLVARALRTVDLPLLGALLALMGIGLAVLYSAAGEAPRMVVAQGARFAVGLAAMWGLSRIPPTRLRHWSPLVYGLSLLPLLLVLAIGQGKHGASAAAPIARKLFDAYLLPPSAQPTTAPSAAPAPEGVPDV
jgi:rod shape determining protein RodA